VAAPASDLALKPGGIDHIHAAAAPMAGLTAWQFLIDLGHQLPSPFQAAALHRPVPLEAGIRVLVNGAAGGVGHVAVQLAKWKGAHVTAVASGIHEPFLRKLGVDEFIDYTTDRAEEVAHDVDLVLDTVGGPESGRFLRTIKRGGALFPVFMAPIDPQEAAKHGVSVSSTQVRASGRQLAELGRLLDSGTVQVAIDSTFPLAEASRAHERAARGHIEGKIVLTVA
jgi:NADPH:quinone reductase-like Zn-dependent oxidoreductase